MSKWLIILTLFITTHAYSYKISIYTDQADDSKANEVIELFKTTYPFNQYEIEYEIVKATAEELNCGSSLGIDRLVTCNSKFVRKSSLEKKTDQAFIVRDLNKYGGSGGGIPVMTTQTPATAMIHEYLHTLGFNDTYTYSAEEAKIYCHQKIKAANMVVITPHASYKDDPEARSTHSGEIPWYKNIKETTPITTAEGTQLGTGSVTGYAAVNNSNAAAALGSPTGLYKGHTCDNAVEKMVGWYPGGENNIMIKLDAGIGWAEEEIVSQILASKGVKVKIGSECSACGSKTN